MRRVRITQVMAPCGSFSYAGSTYPGRATTRYTVETPLRAGAAPVAASSHRRSRQRTQDRRPQSSHNSQNWAAAVVARPLSDVQGSHHSGSGPGRLFPARREHLTRAGYNKTYFDDSPARGGGPGSSLELPADPRPSPTKQPQQSKLGCCDAHGSHHSGYGFSRAPHDKTCFDDAPARGSGPGCSLVSLADPRPSPAKQPQRSKLGCCGSGATAE